MIATATQTSADAAPSRQPLLDRIADRSVRQSSPAFRWGFAAAAFLTATGLRILLDPVLPEGIPFATFFPAVAITAFVAGTLPGAAVAVASLLVAWYAFLSPTHSWELDRGGAVALALYVLVVATEVGLVYLMRRVLRRLASAEVRARELAESRRLMFHELQHRVSNNLAVVGSLLQLQRREVKDPAAVHALEEAVARVNVVSRLNRLLHNPGAQAVDFGAFLRAAVPDVVNAAGVADRVEVIVAAEPVTVPADKAVPLGLVATELLSNALEHGFAGGGRGRVGVSLERPEAGRARLIIRDDGAGLPPGFDLERTRSLGLTVARQFTSQLGARLTIREEGGVVSCLEVPLGD